MQSGSGAIQVKLSCYTDTANIILMSFPLKFHLAQCIEEFIYAPFNVTRTTLSGVAAYRSALTLDWLAAEDNRQRELAAAFETEAAPPIRVLATDCIAYAKPASGKVARLMLELLKNLEGDDGFLILELIQALVRSKLLVETSMLDAEPDLDALVQTPGVMMGEPHATFPRILAMVWISATDPSAMKKHGWCPITKVNKYLTVSRPVQIAKQLRALDPILARARFIMEEFVQHVTPINVYDSKHKGFGKRARAKVTRTGFPPRSTPFNVYHPVVHMKHATTEFAEVDLMGISGVNLISNSSYRKINNMFLMTFVCTTFYFVNVF